MAGKDVYEERRRVEAENRLLEEQHRNKRLKLEASQEEMADMFAAAVKDLLTGHGSVVVGPAPDGGFIVTFDCPAARAALRPSEDQP